MRCRTRAAVASLAIGVIGCVAALAPALGAAAGGEGPIYVGDLEPPVLLGFAISPKLLPVGSATSATLKLGFQETQPVGLSVGISSASFGLDKSISLNPRGVPICRGPGFTGIQIDQAGPVDCRPSEVGKSEAAIELALPESEPIRLSSKGKIYNGGHRGLLIELPLKGMLNGNLDLVVPVRRIAAGPLASEATIKFPQIAAGHGAITELRLELSRPGFVTAECPTGKLRATLAATFRDGTESQEESVRACVRRDPRSRGSSRP